MSETSDFHDWSDSNSVYRPLQVGLPNNLTLNIIEPNDAGNHKVIPLCLMRLCGCPAGTLLSPRYFPPGTSRQASLYRPSDRWVLPQTKLVEAIGAAMPKRPIFVAKLASNPRKNTVFWKGWKCIILLGMRQGFVKYGFTRRNWNLNRRIPRS